MILQDDVITTCYVSSILQIPYLFEYSKSIISSGGIIIVTIVLFDAEDILMAAFFSKFLDKVRGYDIDEEYEDYEDYDEEDEDSEIEVAENIKPGLFRKQSKVVDFAKSTHAGQQVVIIQPSTIETAQEVCNHLRGGRTVICNFEKVDQKIAQRVMDFVTGATYAIDGQVHKVSPMIFVTVPRNVSLMDENHPIGMEYMGAREMYAAK